MKLTRTFNTVLRLPWMVCVALTAGAAWAAPSAALDPKVRVYSQQHCLKCHDADAEKGDFRIDNLSPKVGFEDTLVLWSGEFGRTPWSQDLSDKSLIDQHGRQNQLESFCAWMAGGGVKPGLTYGDTDDMGYRVVNGKIHVHDLHATMLHQLGIDHLKLTSRHLGRDYRLTGVHGEVVKEILV